MADFGEKVPDDRSDGAAGDDRSKPAAPDDRSEADAIEADEAQKRKRLVAARLVVAGVGLTFLIVGFVEFVTKTGS